MLNMVSGVSDDRKPSTCYPCHGRDHGDAILWFLNKDKAKSSKASLIFRFGSERVSFR